MYIVEASVILPVFIVSMIMITGIIPVITVCENVVCSVADELRLDTAKAAFSSGRTGFIVRATSRILSENRGISTFKVNSYRREVSENGIDDLMAVQFSAGFKSSMSLISVNGIMFRGNLMARAFTGTYHTVGEGYDDTVVYVFPQDGRRYPCQRLQISYRSLSHDDTQRRSDDKISCLSSLRCTSCAHWRYCDLF